MMEKGNDRAAGSVTGFEKVACEFEQALLSLDRLTARNMLMDSSRRFGSVQIADQLIGPVLERIGTGWEQGTVALSQVYMSGRICEELVDAVLPPGASDRRTHPKMAIAVLQDYHLLGKRIVYSMLRASGFELLDYGRVAVDDLVHRAKDDGVEILLISTLMLPSALLVKEVREKLCQSGANVKIVVGGAPFRFDDRLWKEVGAHAMGQNASEAMKIITRMAEGVS